MPDWVSDAFAQINAQRLSIQGASLLATLYPIGVLAALIDVRRIARKPRRPIRRKGAPSTDRDSVGLHSRASAGWIAATSLPALVSIWPLVNSVATLVPLKGWAVSLVSLSGILLLSGMIPFAVELVSAAFEADQNGTETQEVSARAAGATSSPHEKAKRSGGANRRRNRRRR